MRYDEKFRREAEVEQASLGYSIDANPRALCHDCGCMDARCSEMVERVEVMGCCWRKIYYTCRDRAACMARKKMNGL